HDKAVNARRTVQRGWTPAQDGQQSRGGLVVAAPDIEITNGVEGLGRSALLRRLARRSALLRHRA
ncbi:hypothetical protein, partial [Comamonas kerstersii]